MRGAGALNLHAGVWVLPSRAAQEAEMRSVQADVRAAGGDAVLLAADVVEGPDAESLRGRFRTDRDQEYAEFCARCAEFVADVDKETAKRKFTSAESEEIENDLGKLDAWLGKIRGRDFFGASLGAAAREALAACQGAAGAFTGRVYDQEGLHGE